MRENFNKFLIVFNLDFVHKRAKKLNGALPVEKLKALLLIFWPPAVNIADLS